MNEIDHTILRRIRRQNRKTIQEVACFLGKNASTVWRYEHGLVRPSAATLCKLADFFNVMVDTFRIKTQFDE